MKRTSFASWALVLVLTCLAGPACNGGRAAIAPGSGSTLASGAAAGGPSGPYAITGPTVAFHPPGRSPVHVLVEVADDDAKRERGLMDRTSLAPDAGMLFIFEREGIYPFWMRDTYIPLDLIYFGNAGRIVEVIAGVPALSESPRAPRTAFRFVLEVNAGFAAEHGITAACPVKLHHVAAGSLPETP